MRLAIFSDIHGNMHALDAVWQDIQKQAPDAIYCLGDLVGYGAFPNEVTAFVHDSGVPTIMGNYDDGVGFDRDECGCAYKDPVSREQGQESLMWTRSVTTADNKTYLRSLEPQIRLEVGGLRLLLVHGSPRKMNEYLYEDRPQASFERLAVQSDADVLMFGHTHLPYQKTVAETLFVNTGSVGKPKDGDPRAGYVVFDTEEPASVSFHRVAYDVAAAAAAIRATDIPGVFADQIEAGRQPAKAGVPNG
jgi:putative phosphoesterase